MFFSSRGNFDTIPGTNSLRDRLSQQGWQSCSSCHFKGLTDGVIWQFNAGPRKSVPLNATFSPHNHTQQRVLNYSAIFDEIEDFELNIRNISGPGNLTTPINGNSFNPNQGLMIGDNGDINIAPTNIVAFAQASAQAVIRNVSADRPTRIRTQVETRAGTCERWLPLWRALVVNQHLSPELRQRIRLRADGITSLARDWADGEESV